MKDETAEWVEKAEGDWRTAQREFAVCEGPNYDAVCFHAQQCAEQGLATVHDVSYLVTWNCRHIANAFVMRKIMALNNKLGFGMPILCTSEELMEE